MTCDDARSLFSARVDEALAPDEAARLAAHFEACAECRAEWARFERTVSLVRAVEPARAPAGFVDRVLERTRPVAWHRRLAGQLFLPLRIKLPIEAAAIVLVAGLAVLIFERSPEMRQAARPEQAPPVASETPAVPDQPLPPPAAAPVDTPRAPADRSRAPTPDRSLDDATRKPDEAKESDVQSRASEFRTKVADERPADRADRDTSAAKPAAPTPPPAAREPLPSARPDAGAKSARLQRAETAPRVAGLGASTVRVRLAATNSGAALVALAEAVSRAGGTEVARRSEADGTVVEVVIPGSGYAVFLRDLHRLGEVTIEQQPDEPPASVSVTVRITR